jgi:hypothetical protein
MKHSWKEKNVLNDNLVKPENYQAMVFQAQKQYSTTFSDFFFKEMDFAGTPSAPF